MTSERYVPGHMINYSFHAVQFELSNGGDLQNIHQEYLLGEGVTGMLLMPIGVDIINFLPKPRVEVSYELGDKCDRKIFLIHERPGRRPECTIK